MLVCVFRAQVCSFCAACTCMLCCTWVVLSVSRRCPPCQISGIYKSRQWKTDHRASSCHTSILPRASKDSLQHALLIPLLLQTKFSAAFHWFFPLCAAGVHQRGSIGVAKSAALYVSLEINFVLFESMFSRTPLWMTLSSAVCHFKLFFTCVCLLICVCLSLCGGVWELLLMWYWRGKQPF